MGRKKPDWFATCDTISRPNRADASVQFMATAARCACCTDGHVGNVEGPGGFNAGIAGRYAWQAVRADNEEVGRFKTVESGVRKQTILYFTINRSMRAREQFLYKEAEKHDIDLIFFGTYEEHPDSIFIKVQIYSKRDRHIRGKEREFKIEDSLDIERELGLIVRDVIEQRLGKN